MSEVMAGVMGEAFRHPEVADILRERLRNAPLNNWLNAIIDRAVERGELTPLTLPPRAARLPIDLIRSQAIFDEGKTTRETVEELVDEVYIPLLHGLAAR